MSLTPSSIHPPRAHSTREAIALEERYGAHNYHPLPVVLSRGEGVYLWDPEGRRYLDFLSAYSAVNQGHCHPRLVEVLREQAGQLTLTSRAFHNDRLGPYAAYLCDYFGYERMLPMNSGAEAVETAIKLARKWGHERKGVALNRAKIVVCSENFHGRTTTIVSFSTDPSSRAGFGPYTPGFEVVPYGDIDALERALRDPEVVGFLVEPIQGEAGVVVPPSDYLVQAHALCLNTGVLFIADEIQTGVARTGSLLAMCGDCACAGHCERGATYRKPDVLILGKALSGGMYPVSAVLADEEVMGVIRPGEHGSTFGGNPLAAAIAMEALEVVRDEHLAQNARRMGEVFRSGVRDVMQETSLIASVRGKGLLNAVVVNDSPDSETAWELCMQLMQAGLLAKPTHGNIIRFAPPLVIHQEQMEEGLEILKRVFLNYRR
ncbi:ornithine--oxo-acid transaminase [bacterium]|nr:ornithine--oxo-acid transaminase [bacterium]